MPAILPPSTSTSLGHFTRTARSVGTMSATAKAETKPSSAARAAGQSGRRMVEV
jgi:hypothetical protein